MQVRVFRAVALTVALLCVLGSVCACENPFKKEQTTEVSNGETETPNESYVIVRAVEAGKTEAQICSNLKDLLVAEGLEATVEKDDSVAASKDAEKFYIVVGESALPLSKTNQARVGQGMASFLTEENCLSICALDEQILWLAVEQMAQSCLEDGSFVLSEEYKDTQKDYSSQLREDWTFRFPAYSAGGLNEERYSCGYGLVQSGELSYMHVIHETNALEFEQWKQTVISCGYREVFSNQIEENQYVCYQSAFGTLYYAQFFNDTGKVNVIRDTDSVALDEFCYTIESDDHPEFYMFQTNVLGMEDLFLIHASDDSWIVIDGGTAGYGDYPESFGDEIFEFMANRSEMVDGKLVISAWYVSHAHRDHFTGFNALLKLHGKEIDLQRVILNMPDPELHSLTGIDHLENDSQNAAFKVLADLIDSLYPDVKVLKVHTGMEIRLADVSFTVLHTQEDLLEQWYNGNAEWDLTNFNMTSLVSMIEMDNMRILELADNFRPDLTLNHYSMESTLACDILKVGHHYNDRQGDLFYQQLYDTCAFKYALVPDSGFDTSGTYMQEKLRDRFICSSDEESFGFYFDGSDIVCNQYQE